MCWVPASKRTRKAVCTPVGERTDLELGIGYDDSELYGSLAFFSVFLFFYGG